MFQIEITNADGAARQLDVPDEAMVGSRPTSDVLLDSWRVSKDHARLVKTPAGVLLEDMGTFIGVSVNGARITSPHGPLRDTDVIGIGPFKLRVTAAIDAPPPVQAAAPHSRSTSAPVRNLRAAEEIQASRVAAEKMKQQVWRQLRRR
jgi:pilus assembly protein CpaF